MLVCPAVLFAMEGVHAFFAECRARRLKPAVATSADRVKLSGNLAEIGLPPDSFDAIVTGDDIRQKKPGPEIFLTAAARLGLPPSECLVVENAVNGVQAAKTAGARCLGITTSFDAATLLAAGADLATTHPDVALL